MTTKKELRDRLEDAERIVRLLKDHLEHNAKAPLDCHSCEKAVREWDMNRLPL